MISPIARKLIGLYVKVRYYRVPSALRAFYKDTVMCKYRQGRYWFRDFVLRKPYKTLSFYGEFAPDLQFALPHAYWHYLNGTLQKTEAAKYTKELYFFSENHEEVFDTRTNEGNYNYDMPRVLYGQDYDMNKWQPVPLKEKYKNDVYVYERPILLIANRYNMEWGGPPISFLSLEVLEYIIENLSDQYQIIYNRPRPEHITNDNSEVYELNEYDWLKERYPHVILVEDLYKENKIQAKNFNHFQFCLYANAERFVSVHGGTATLASYFGGINIILSKKGPEHHFQCYQKLYPKFSGALIAHAKSDEELKLLVDEHLKTSPNE
ncbi:hypothetical protein LAG90_08790 [Marinilongibacter aquaticus]|uniref:hypothetical protein n=1 Tax=Marinilongibacter aquaticus TaxID=2975157 RepID=UPI0021BCFC02|nr:hypothetical protein [Marinilongibacter aquaticus]UBM60730.1 hypothetical protein LAG90_08790 [Marinilongibacter aquaticus]